jgi:hypothetical protein
MANSIARRSLVRINKACNGIQAGEEGVVTQTEGSLVFVHTFHPDKVISLPADQVILLEPPIITYNNRVVLQIAFGGYKKGAIGSVRDVDGSVVYVQFGSKETPIRIPDTFLKLVQDE